MDALKKLILECLEDMDEEVQKIRESVDDVLDIAHFPSIEKDISEIL